MERSKNLISVLELRRLLVDIIDKRPDICVRFRLLGEMWDKHAMRVVKVTDKGVILNNEIRNKFETIYDLGVIMQFEIDAPFLGFQPHFHYEVKPVLEFKH